jgi:hypothetical protein
LQALGVGAEILEQARQQLEERNRLTPTAVWSEHFHALTVLQAMGSQWRVVAGLSGALYTGMDYAALPVVFDACAPRVPRRHRQKPAVLFDQLQVMEAAVLRVRNDER